MTILLQKIAVRAVFLSICFSPPISAESDELPALRPNSTEPPFLIGSSAGIPPNVSLHRYQEFVYLTGAEQNGPRYQARRFEAISGQLDPWRLSGGASLAVGAGDWLVYVTAQDAPPGPRLISAVNLQTGELAPYVLKVAEDFGCLEAVCPFVTGLAAGQRWAYVGGRFSTDGSTSLFRFEVSSGDMEPLNVEGIYDVNSMVTDERNIYCATRRVGSGPPGRLVAVSHENIRRTQWSLEVTDVWSLWLKNGRLWVAGDFQTIGGLPRKYLASLNPQTGEVLPEEADFQFTFVAFPGFDIIGQFGDYLVISGYFNLVNERARDRIAIVNPITGEVHPWNPGLDGYPGSRPTVFVASKQQIFLAGYFSEIGGLERSNFAVFDLIAPPEMSAPKLEATGFTARVKAASTYAHVLQRSGDLGLWENVSTNTPTTAEFTVSDPAPASTERYYRILLQ